jgi:AAA domain/DnaB-like helicase N terminal domain
MTNANGRLNGILPAHAVKSLREVASENESRFVASLLRYPEKVKEISALVGVEHFAHDAARRVFRAIRALDLQGKPIGYVEVHNQIVQAGDLKEVTCEYLNNLVDFTISAHDPAIYAAQVLENADRRQLGTLGGRLLHEAESPSGPTDAFIADVSAQLERMKSRTPAAKTSKWPAPLLVSELSTAGAAVDFLWHGCIAKGHLTLFSALMKAGKTTFLGHMLRALQDGLPFVGRATRQCRTLYVSEESQGLWCGRRDALGLSDQLSLLCRPMFAKPSQAEWSEFIAYVGAQALERKCDLVVFDTISSFAPWRDENASAEVQAALTPLNQLTQFDLAVLLVHHMGKTDGSQGRAARGSTALAGAMDVLLELRRFKDDDRQDRRRVLTGLGRFDEVPDELVVTLEDDGSGYTSEGDRKAMLARELADAVLRVLPDDVPGIRGDELHTLLDEEIRPQRSKLQSILLEGVGAGLWQASGTGKKGDPRRFHKGGEAIPV